MIFFGSAGKNIKNGQITNIDCPNCNENTSMIYSVFGKYAHIYWIPFFPTGKKTFTECNKCKRTFEESEFSKEMLNKLLLDTERTGKSKFPLWMFSGLGIVAALFAFGYYQGNKDDENFKKFAENPKAGDLYHFKLENSFYTTAKVKEVNKDSVLVVFNDYETDIQSGIDKIDKEKNYSIGIYSYSKERIKELEKVDTIFEIDRK